MKRRLHHLRCLHEVVALHAGYGLLGIGCLLWSALAMPLAWVMPGRRGAWLGRRAATLGFRGYLLALRVIGVARFDIGALDALRHEGALIIAPNHPSLLDALMVISRLPNVVCVQKSSLLDSPLWGAGSRLAGYIRNDWFIGSVKLAVEELHRGSQLLLFPEGTRSEPRALGDFRAGAAYASYRAGVPIQTVLIEQDSEFLGKEWPLLKRPDFPVHYRIRLGRRFDPPADPKAFSVALRGYFESELHAQPRRT